MGSLTDLSALLKDLWNKLKMENLELDRTINSKKVYEGNIINVKVDEVLLKTGVKAEREVVEHKPAVAIVPVDSENNVLLVRQYRHPAKVDLLEVPAGIIEPEEEPEVAALRELQEEVGYTSRDLRLIFGFWTSPGFTDEYIYGFIARDLVPKTLPQDYDEDISVEKIPISRLQKLIRLGEIQDSKSIALLMTLSSTM